MKLIASFLIGFSFAALACGPHGDSGFLPENNLYIPVGAKSAFGGITKAQFDGVIDRVEAMYAPTVANMGGNLRVIRNWTDGTVNAYADRDGAWNVSMFGGLARHQTITEDGFALVMCHELGHHIGGAPKYTEANSRWASNEGQSDYFAATKCLRRVFLFDDNIAIVKRMNVPQVLAESCNYAFGGRTRGSLIDRAICIRTGMAGASVAALFAALRQAPPARFETPDRNVVSRTYDAHPAHQCRLDTFFQGAICDIPGNEPVSQTDEVRGTCHGALGFNVGLRPACWFKAKR